MTTYSVTSDYKIDIMQLSVFSKTVWKKQPAAHHIIISPVRTNFSITAIMDYPSAPLVTEEWTDGLSLHNNLIWYFKHLAAYITCHERFTWLCYIPCLVWLYYQSFANICDLLTIFFMVIQLESGQSFDCPSFSEITLEDMGKIDQHQTITKHTNMCIILAQILPKLV